ncbi:hypothetical protein BN946_scf184857.g52 [Trametes cinnabarina]|uniref:Uncharacterized protein n=1 Tax=Pycnoporus cinnabarinus TaxID=5643 RepID=A0A060SSU8_PYCCI|nr:hypothetical protein BN946_scf184857.g52 [Trametes cinnabarina]
MAKRATRGNTKQVASASATKPRAESKHWSRADATGSEENKATANKHDEDIIERTSLDEDVVSLDSDALDDDDDFEVGGQQSINRKRKCAVSAAKEVSPTKNTAKKTPQKKRTVTPRKKRKLAKVDASEDEEEEDLELEEGQEVVGVVVQAPKAGREPVYRLAESEWKAFVEEFTDLLVEVDPQIPHLPPKDVIHRIYRDVRFSNDKTPYKTGFSASYSRSGRKGIFAHYHMYAFLPDAVVKAGDESLIAAGAWCPGKNELQTIRNNLLRSSRRLRSVISAPEFEALFGPARPHPQGLRQNIFGLEDELKVAPKGVDKTLKDIDLLKCRSFAVVHKFTDTQVLSSTFKEELANVARVMRPLVHCLNDMMTIPDADSSDDDEDQELGDEGEDEDGGDA